MEGWRPLAPRGRRPGDGLWYQTRLLRARRRPRRVSGERCAPSWKEPLVAALAATHRAAVGIRLALDRYEFPVVRALPQRQLQNTVRAVIARLAVGRPVPELVKALAASPDDEGLRAVRVGLASGVLRSKPLIKVIVGLQNDIDVVGNQELHPGFYSHFRRVSADAGEVCLMPEGNRAWIPVDGEVLLQPGRDLIDAASSRPRTGIGESNEVPATPVERVRRVRLEGDRAPVAMRTATIEVFQWIGVRPTPIMLRRKDWVHLRDVRAPIVIEIGAVFPHRAVLVLIVAQSEDEIGFGRLGCRGGGDR